MLNPKLLILAAFAARRRLHDQRQRHDLIGTAAVPVAVTEIAGNHSIFVATTRERRPTPRSSTTRVRRKLNFARVNVTVPESHETGQIERKSPASPTIR